jgi:hypothetical protein
MKLPPLTVDLIVDFFNEESKLRSYWNWNFKMSTVVYTRMR